MQQLKHLLLGTALLTSVCSYGQSGARLIWADEFNSGSVPDTTRWGYNIGTGNNGWGNQELQYYTNRPENAAVSDGTLKIKAIKEAYNGSAYTSARLLTKGKFDFKYGKVEVRARLPVGKGTWPAIWMLGANISEAGWPACGEIDIMEHKGSDPGKIYGTVHHPGHSGANGDGLTTMIGRVSEDFHVYTADWSASGIRFYVDGKHYYTFTNNASVPFNHHFFILLNFAVGGGFGGPVDPAFTSGVFEIDYVRVYQY